MAETPRNLETITKEWLEMMLKEAFGHTITVDTFTASAATKKGDNFVSLLASVAIVTKEGNPIDIVVKLAPEGDFKKTFFKESLMFEKEACMYKELTKDMDEFQLRRFGKVLIQLPFPKCYYVHDEEDGRAAIVMDNLRARQYRMFDKKKPYDLQHASMALKGIAKLHALTFAYQTVEGVDLQKKYSWLRDTWLEQEDAKEFFDSVLDTLISVLKAMDGQEEAAKKVEAYNKVHNISKRYKELVAPRPPVATITHGDFWNNNMMFKYEDESSDPSDFKLLDLQICKYSSPSSDLVYFFYSSTDGEFRKKHLSTMLRLYYDSFMADLKTLQVAFDEKDYSFQQFVADFDATVELGFIMASMVIPFILSEGDAIPDMDDIKEHEIKQFMDDWNAKLAKSANEATKRRVLSLVEEVIERGII